MAEHPVEAHEYLLSDMRQRIEALEEDVQELIKWKAGSEERLRFISEALIELKTIMSQYTTDMKEGLASVIAKVDARFLTIEEDIKDLKGRSGRKWDEMVRTIITVAIGILFGYLFNVVIGGR